jgi:murein DD-endopeptidase MepM/ murein hydrolase activator NlpD
MRVTGMWDRLAGGGYVSDAYVRRGATPPACAAVNAVAAPATTWVHPLPGFPAGNSFRTPKQPYHIGVDLMAFNGTPIRAASAGRVAEVVCNIEMGQSCDRPGSPSIRGCGWYVKLEHADRVSTLYCHLVRKPDLTVGQQISAGQVIGNVGSSGNSSYPHLHFEVHIDSPPTGPHNAVNPITFMRTRGVALDR